MIALDMDGTIADLYAVNDWCRRIRSNDATPYSEARPMVNACDLASAIDRAHADGVRVEVISWGCGGEPSAQMEHDTRAAKLNWLDANGASGLDAVRVVRHGTPKSTLADGCAALIDDEQRNRDEWERSGRGPACDAGDPVRTILAILRHNHDLRGDA